jgi:YggT family protein
LTLRLLAEAGAPAFHPCRRSAGPVNHESRRIPGVSMRPFLEFLLRILELIGHLLDLYIIVIIIVAILSWLIAFNVINIYNDIVRSIWNALNALTEPFLQRIRRFMPNLGGVDISPIVLIILVQVAKYVVILIEDIITRYVYPNTF